MGSNSIRRAATVDVSEGVKDATGPLAIMAAKAFVAAARGSPASRLAVVRKYDLAEHQQLVRRLACFAKSEEGF